MRALPLVTLLFGLLLPVDAGAEHPAGAPEIGGPVPDFEATSLEGQAVSLGAALDGHKAVVVIFLSTVCPYVNHFAGHLQQLDEVYRPRGVLLIGVNSNNWESRTEVAEHARERGFAFPIVKDERHEIANLLGAARTPEAFLIDSAGRLRYRGWVKSKQESPDLQRALDAVLQGGRVARPVTRSFGCAIDRF
jgi:peroxiredoxin